jgi:class 3 adenylate cyclase
LSSEQEATFLAWHALRSRRQMRWLSLVLLASGILFLAVERSPPAVLWLRIALIAGTLPVIGFFWRASPEHWIDWWEPVTTIAVLLLLAVELAIAVLTWHDVQLLINHAAGLALLPVGVGFGACLRGRHTAVISAVAAASGTALFAAAPTIERATAAGVGIVLAMSGVIGAFASFQLESALRRVYAASTALAQERARSEELLQNILPAPIAEQLKNAPGAIAERFPEATVLFADIVGFTGLVQELPPERIVLTLDGLFSAFDDIAERHGLEKIKTIGDAYMVVGGVPTRRADHAEAVARMALEMREVAIHHGPAGRGLRLRIGMDTGPVVAGIIGKRKFLYDLWGDTVNTASRMESHGVDDAIQLTETTYVRLRASFVLEPRGMIQVKGKGEMATWFLIRQGG